MDTFFSPELEAQLNAFVKQYAPLSDERPAYLDLVKLLLAAQKETMKELAAIC